MSQIPVDIENLLTNLKSLNADFIKRDLCEQKKRIILQSTENIRISNQLTQLRNTPMNNIQKLSLLRTLKSDIDNLSRYSDSIDYSLDHIYSNLYPIPVIEYALQFENEHDNEMFGIHQEMTDIFNLLSVNKYSSNKEDDDSLIKYLSDKIMRTIQINAELKALYQNSENEIQYYRAYTSPTLSYEPSLSSSTSESEIINIQNDNDREFRNYDIPPVINCLNTTTNNFTTQLNETNNLNNLLNTKWDLISYDVSHLLHREIELTPDEIQEKFTKIIQAHMISEKLFCKAVLNTTSKVIRRLFSVKRSWNTMKAKDRIIMLRIYMWINDPNGVRKLKDWTNYIKANTVIAENSTQEPEISENSKSEIIDYNPSEIKLPENFQVEELSIRFKQTIEKNGISQKLFARAVLNVAQSTISKFLSKPKEYYESNSLAQSTYAKIYAWLNDPIGLQKLNQWVDKYKWNEHTQNEIDILDEITRRKNESSISYEAYDLSIMEHISTVEIRNRLKADLEMNKISQKLFSRAVLNKAESTLSLLLSNPKTWETLNMKSKEKYLQIYKWLNDPHRLEKLDVWEKKETEKKLKSKTKETTKFRRMKLVLNRHQEIYLTKLFNYNMYPTRSQMELIATNLKLNLIKIINWFNHKRRKFNMNRCFSKTTKKTWQNSNNNSTNHRGNIMKLHKQITS